MYIVQAGVYNSQPDSHQLSQVTWSVKLFCRCPGAQTWFWFVDYLTGSWAFCLSQLPLVRLINVVTLRSQCEEVTTISRGKEACNHPLTATFVPVYQPKPNESTGSQVGMHSLRDHTRNVVIVLNKWLDNSESSIKSHDKWFASTEKANPAKVNSFRSCSQVKVSSVNPKNLKLECLKISPCTGMAETFQVSNKKDRTRSIRGKFYRPMKVVLKDRKLSGFEHRCPRSKAKYGGRVLWVAHKIQSLEQVLN